MEFYQPAVNTINGKMMSSDITAIQARISGLEFNGPSYDSHSTIEALQFAADHLNVAHKGVFQHIVLVAPETETNVSSTLDKIMLIGNLPIFFNSCMWQGFDTKISVFCIDVRTYHFSEKNYVQVFLSLNLPSIRKWNPNSTPKLINCCIFTHSNLGRHSRGKMIEFTACIVHTILFLLHLVLTSSF